MAPRETIRDPGEPTRVVRGSLRAATVALTPLVATIGLLLTGCVDASDDDQQPKGALDLRTIEQPLDAVCQISVTGRGTKDVENDYLARVVTCENGNADIEALKAQAVAARSYMYYKFHTSGSISDGQGDQVYTCSREPEQKHRDAVAATSGKILRYANTYVAAFYVAGAIPSTQSCVPASSDWSPSQWPESTESRVTYNWERTGAAVELSSLGWVPSNPLDNPANRGCQSQNGANCLSRAGWSWQDIIKFYYGMDIEIVQVDGSCVDASVSTLPCETSTQACGDTSGTGDPGNNGGDPGNNGGDPGNNGSDPGNNGGDPGNNGTPPGDFCEDQGWYGDGVCDACPMPDPDCEGDDGTSGDFCADNNYYNDGQCDPDCPMPDPDCAPDPDNNGEPANNGEPGNNGGSGDFCQDMGLYTDDKCTPDCPSPDPGCREPGNNGAVPDDRITDYCRLRGLYGDGICDKICDNPDPDCTTRGPSGNSDPDTGTGTPAQQPPPTASRDAVKGSCATAPVRTPAKAPVALVLVLGVALLRRRGAR